jgi:DNA-binding NarL/FixJ family response regulator
MRNFRPCPLRNFSLCCDAGLTCLIRPLHADVIEIDSGDRSPLSPQATISGIQTSSGAAVVIAAANAMDCQLLARILSGRQHSQVVGWATDSMQAEALIREARPDVALMSIRLSDGPAAGLTALRNLRQSPIETRIIMLLDVEDPPEIIEAFRHGARGIFCRTAAASELLKCIRCVQNGQIWASNSQLEYLVQALAHTPAIPPAPSKSNPGLSGRENQVARLVA